jgi:hypothetical protein
VGCVLLRINVEAFVVRVSQQLHMVRLTLKSLTQLKATRAKTDRCMDRPYTHPCILGY